MTKIKAKIFIDGSNIYFAQKKIGRQIDWAKVKRYFTKEYQLLGINYYHATRKTTSSDAPFLKRLSLIGFTLVSKPIKIIYDEANSKYIEKANFDVEITADILQSLNETGRVILFSGDSDFEYLVKIIKKQNKTVWVYSSRKTLSWELKLSANRYNFIEDLPSLTKSKTFVKL